MTDISAQQIASFAVHAVAAVVWGGMALHSWRLPAQLVSRIALFGLLRGLATSTAVFYACQAGLRLVPRHLAFAPPTWLILLWLAGELAILATAVTARHAALYWGLRFAPPSRAWLLVNYGSGAVALGGALGVAIGRLPLGPYLVARSIFVAALLAMAVWSVARVARRGSWTPGAGANVVRKVDVAILAGGVMVMMIAISLLVRGLRGGAPQWTGVAIDALIATAVTLPIAVRELHVVLRSLAIAASAAAVATILAFGAHALVTSLTAAGAPRLVDLLLVVLLTLGMAVAAGIPPLVDRALFGRKKHLWEDLQRFLTALDPREGVIECCHRALRQVVRASGLRGAAIVLNDGQAIVEGVFRVDRVAQLWPRGVHLDALPGTLVSPEHLATLDPEVVEALIEAEVTGAVTIDSPRRRWGTLFGTSGIVEPLPDDAPAVEAFTAELAIVLDTAALIEHTVVVERSLAHAEKLAAIGEVAARIAHEIRNPVTAARSLAQLMSRDPTAAENVESVGLILSELERVERHVRALLRFARREEYSAEPVDLGDLARESLLPFGPRLAASGVHVHVDVSAGVMVRGDREKLRQVMVNLVENALDALGDVPNGRIALDVVRENGRATLRLTDNGPGIPSESAARVFEPFFSTKPSGTGLGLAIVRRIIDAHGGKITAAGSAASGTTFRIDLPADESLGEAPSGRS